MFALTPLPRTLNAALRDLEAKRPDIRRSAVVDLARYADTEHRSSIVDAIGRVLRGDSEMEVRAAAAMAVADAALTELTDQLVEALDDPAPRVKQMVLLAIGALQPAVDQIDCQRIRSLIHSEAPALRYQALIAWCRIHRQDGLEQLLSALVDEDEEVRWIAWTLIEEQLDAEPQQSTQPSLGVSAQAEGARDPRSVLDAGARHGLAVRLALHVNDTSVRIRIISASVMSLLGDDRYLGKLLDTLQANARFSSEELLGAIECFERRRFRPACQWLAQRARCGWFEGALGWPATVALAALQDPKAESAILAELETRSARRRTRALQAIGRLRLTRAIASVRALADRAPGVEPWLVRETLAAIDPDDGREPDQ